MWRPSQKSWICSLVVRVQVVVVRNTAICIAGFSFPPGLRATTARSNICALNAQAHCTLPLHQHPFWSVVDVTGTPVQRQSGCGALRFRVRHDAFVHISMYSFVHTYLLPPWAIDKCICHHCDRHTVFPWSARVNCTWYTHWFSLFLLWVFVRT